jgi:hypothetical protein
MIEVEHGGCAFLITNLLYNNIVMVKVIFACLRREGRPAKSSDRGCWLMYRYTACWLASAGDGRRFVQEL